MEDPRHPASELPVSSAATVIGDDPSQLVGAVIGPYKLVEQIGEGGFGLVFVAEQHSPVRRRVALKVIKPGMDTHDVISRFEAERQALALMDHPNIARVLDAGATAAGRPYFVMELVRGIPITDYCDNNRLTLRERLELFVSVCQAVQHAHQKGIIHRDIKPSNVLVMEHDRRPVVKVIDFGVAKALYQPLTDRTIYTRVAQMVGTPLYMSPEQAERSGLDIDTRSDIYSLGVVLYELLTGTTPFDRKRLSQAAYDELIRIIRQEEPPKPSTRLSRSGESLPAIAAQRKTDPARLSGIFRGDLDWITMKALEKDRSRRYETADGLARDIQRYLSDQPVEACPPSVAYRFRKFARRNRAAFGTAAIVTLALLAGIVISTWQAVRATIAERAARSSEVVARDQKREADEAKKQAEQRRDELAIVNDNLRRVNYVADMNLARVAWDENNLARTRELLDRYVPEAGAADLRGFEWHYLRRLLHGDVLTLKAHEGSVTDVAFTPDGRRLFTGGTKQPHQAMPLLKFPVGQAKLWDAKTGNAVDFKLKGLADTAKTVVLSRDGRHVAATCSDGLILFWDQISDEPITLAAPGKQIPRQIRFSPDGHHLVSVYDPADLGGRVADTVRVWDPVARKCIMTLDGVPVVSCAEFSPDGNQLALCLLNQGVVEVVNVKTGTEAYRCTYADAFVDSTAFSPDGKRLFASGGKGIRAWNVAARDTAATWPSTTIGGMCLSFSPDGTRLAMAGVEGFVEVRDSATGDVLHTFKGHSGSVEALAFNPDGTRLASGGLDGTVRLWNTTGQIEGASIGRVPPDVRILELSPDGQTLLTGLNDTSAGPAGKSFRLWNTSTFQPRDDRIETPEIVENCDWSDDGKRLFLTDRENTITVVDVATSRVLKKLRVDVAETIVTALAGDARSYAYCAPGGVIRLRDMKTWKESRIIKGPNERVHQLALNFDGSRLASAYENGEARIWDTATGLSTASLNLRNLLVMRLRFSRDGRHLAIVGNLSRLLTGEVRIVDAESGSQLPLKGHTLNVFDCTFSPDGQRLATTSADKTIRIWDLATGQEVLKLVGYTAWVNCIRFDAQGRRLIGAARDGTIHIWDAMPLLDEPQ